MGDVIYVTVNSRNLQPCVIFVTSLNICLFVFVPGTAILRASRLPMNNRLRSRGWLKGPTRDTRQKSRWTGRQTDLSCENTGLHTSVHPEWFDNTLLIPFVTYHNTWVRARNFLKCQSLMSTLYSDKIDARPSCWHTTSLPFRIKFTTWWQWRHMKMLYCLVLSCVRVMMLCKTQNANVDKLKSSTFRIHEVDIASKMLHCFDLRFLLTLIPVKLKGFIQILNQV